MDDGSKKPHRESGISIHTNNFTYEDNVFLCKVLKHNFNLDVITSVDKRSKDGTPYYKLYVLVSRARGGTRRLRLVEADLYT